MYLRWLNVKFHTGKMSNGMRLRDRIPGELLPDILLNDDSTELWKRGKTLDELIVIDGQCDLLLIMGTSLKSRGAAGVVKKLANNAHEYGGMVIYIDKKSLPTHEWASYIDLHLEADLEEWAKCCLKSTAYVSTYLCNDCISWSECLMNLPFRMDGIDALLPTERYNYDRGNVPCYPSIFCIHLTLSTISKLAAIIQLLGDMSNDTLGGGLCESEQTQVSRTCGKKKVRFVDKHRSGSSLDDASAAGDALYPIDKFSSRSRIVLAVCYHSSATFETATLAAMIVKSCAERGWEVR
jgi:hypothetical protein